MKSKRVSKATKRLRKRIKQASEKKVRLVNYKITYDAIVEPNFSRLPEQVKSRIAEIHKV